MTGHADHPASRERHLQPSPRREAWHWLKQQDHEPPRQVARPTRQFLADLADWHLRPAGAAAGALSC